MSDTTGSAPHTQGLVAVVGAGPAGLYAAQVLAAHGAQVALLNRDVKPGGLAEYGIFPTKHKMKDGLRKQFRSILDSDRIEYFGNVTVGTRGTLTVGELRGLCDAVLITAGAQGTKWLGVPGEELRGVFHAKDLVYHYNRLPPFATRTYEIGSRVAIVGVGNVMLDIAHWLVRLLKIDEVVAVARRGPAEVKFDKAEMEHVAGNLDLAALDAEIERVRPLMERVGQDPAAARQFILSALPKAVPPVSSTRFRLAFLASPAAVVGENGRVTGLEVEETELMQGSTEVECRGSGRRRVIACDTVVFAVGDRVDPDLGLAVERSGFATCPEPECAVEGVSYEAMQDGTQRLEGVFLAGWARLPSTGLVGIARKDGSRGANAVLQYLSRRAPGAGNGWAPLRAQLERAGATVVDKRMWRALEEAEREEAQKRGEAEFKFPTDAEMLNALGRTSEGAR